MQSSFLGFLFFFLALWVGISWLLAMIGGWSKLSDKYRAMDSFLGSCAGWRWGQIGLVNYRSSLWVGASSEGLYLKTGPLFLLRAFHPPLLIPWTAIKSICERKYWWMRILEVTLNDSNVRIRIQSSNNLYGVERFLGDKLALLEKN